MSLDVAATNPAAFAEGLTDRIIRQFKVAAQDWLDVCRRLSEWEDQHLVDNADDPETLAQHSKVVGSLEEVGRLIANITKDPQFEDRQFAEVVACAQQDLRDRAALWHGAMTPSQREQLLQEIFPHES